MLIYARVPHSRVVYNELIPAFITPILKSLVVTCNLIDSNWCDLFTNRTIFFALTRIFFPANEEATLETKQPIRFQGSFKVTNQIAGK